MGSLRRLQHLRSNDHRTWRTTTALQLGSVLKLSLQPADFALMPSTVVASQTPTGDPGGTAVMEKAPERVRKPSPRYKVLLHNDPVNTMEYVVTTLRQVVPLLSEQDAIAVMLEAHNTGVGLVIVCDLEPAEFYSETLKSKGLSSSIEPES